MKLMISILFSLLYYISCPTLNVPCDHQNTKQTKTQLRNSASDYNVIKYVTHISLMIHNQICVAVCVTDYIYNVEQSRAFA